MFLPDSCDILFGFPCSTSVNCVVANRERTIVAVVTDENLSFYLADTRLLACIYQKEEMNVREQKPFEKAFWKPDSSAICVMSRNCLNIFSVDIISNHSTFVLHDPPMANSSFSRESTEFYLSQNRPKVNTTLSVIAHLEAEPTCVLSFKDEFFVCLADGWLHRMSWAGTVLQNLSFNIRSVCATPNLFSKKNERCFGSAALCILDIAPFLGGICIVLSDGRGALLNSTSSNFQPNSISALWAAEMKDACCCATNFKYRLIYFGTKSGDVVLYSRDDINETLVQLSVIRLTLKNGTEFLGRLTTVRQIRSLSPHGSAFAVIWDSFDDASIVQNGTESNSVEDSRSLTLLPSTGCETPPALALFSPFGAQWWCSLEDHSGSLSSFHYTTLDWAFEGFQLWMGCSDGVQLINLIQSAENSHSRHVVMFGSDRLYLSPSITADQATACNAPHFIWKVLRPPHNYISANGPITLIATDFDCNRLLAIAASHGFCLYNFKLSKWRMFRKESQEQSLKLIGGLEIYENYIICSASNTEFPDGEKERIYVFHAEKQLDLDEANSIPTNRILQMSLNRCSHLLTFDVNSLIAIYSVSLFLENDHGADSLSLECLAEIRIAEFLPHPNCLISMDLARLNFYSDAVPFCDDMDSLLVNISGHLLLLSPMQCQQSNGDGNSGKKKANDDIENNAEFQLHPPTLVASFVERFWTALPSNQRKPTKTEGRIAFLEDALWINAGCKNSKVWLPLSTDQNLNNSSTGAEQMRRLSRQSSRAFISRRIMLPIGLGIYPLCVSDDYLACGASCLSSQPKSSAKLSDNISLVTDDGSSSLSSFVGIIKNDFASRLSVHTLVRVNEVFIHKLLKQLLKRNLGAFAFDLATACRSLSYFGHILELLLHDLLDEEATSSEPIPDPLLPTAVAFLREFPSEYLRTIVFCARKTELAFWSLLFSVSHHPRQLFQMCLKEGQLDTATSCLMILHSMENFKESSKLAFRLLEEALAKRKWTVAKDIVRFMHNISLAVDQELGSFCVASEVPDSPLQHKLASLQSHYHYHQSKIAVSGFNSAPAADFSFPLFSSSLDFAAGESSAAALRNRTMSSGKTAEHSESRKISAAVSRQTQPIQQQKAKSRQISPPSKDKLSANANSPILNASKPSETTERGQNLADGYEKIQGILSKYALHLLEDYALRDLAAFASYLQFDLAAFFRDNAFSIAPEEFPVVLMKLHAQFNWPFPVSLSAALPTNNNSSVLYNGKFTGQMTNGLTAIQSPQPTNDSLEGDESGTETIDSDKQMEKDGTFGGAIFCDWKVLKKFEKETKVRGTAQTETELAFVVNILQRAEAFEWIYLLCILRQDIRQFKDRVLAPMQTLPEGRRRTEEFMNKVRTGSQELFRWTLSACPAYATIVRVFNEIVNAQQTL